MVGFLSPYKRRLAWTSAIFALIADISMIYFGGALKAKQKITGRLGDILSWMYLATCTMVYYEKHRDNKDLKPIVEWALDYCFYNIQVALIGYFENFTWITRLLVAPIYRVLRVGTHPSDALGKTISVAIQANQSLRSFLTDGTYAVDEDKPGMGKLNYTYKQLIQSEQAFKKIRRAVKSVSFPKAVTFVLDDAVNLNIITAQEGSNPRCGKGTLGCDSGGCIYQRRVSKQHNRLKFWALNSHWVELTFIGLASNLPSTHSIRRDRDGIFKTFYYACFRAR